MGVVSASMRGPGHMQRPGVCAAASLVPWQGRGRPQGGPHPSKLRPDSHSADQKLTWPHIKNLCSLLSLTAITTRGLRQHNGGCALTVWHGSDLHAAGHGMSQ